MCGKIPSKGYWKRELKRGCHISFCISSSLHSVTNSTSASISWDLSHCNFDSEWALLWCLGDLIVLPALIGGCCSKAWSHTSVVHLTRPAFCTSSVWQDTLPSSSSLSFTSDKLLLSHFCLSVLLSLLSWYPSPNCSIQGGWQITDGRLMHRKQTHTFAQVYPQTQMPSCCWGKKKKIRTTNVNHEKVLMDWIGKFYLNW